MYSGGYDGTKGIIVKVTEVATGTNTYTSAYLTGTGDNSFTFNFTASNTGAYRITIKAKRSTGTNHNFNNDKFFKVDNITITHQEITNDLVCTSYSDYRYGFGGQEKVDEVSGEGNSYTAEFWQYSPRIGRRWNTDPVVKEHESPYAAFANNPVWLIDPNGADTTRNESGQLSWEFEDGDTYYGIGKKLQEYGITETNEYKNLQGAYDGEYDTHHLHNHTGAVITLDGVLGDNSYGESFDNAAMNNTLAPMPFSSSLSISPSSYSISLQSTSANTLTTGSTANKILFGLSTTGSVLEYGSGVTTIGTNFKLYSSGWRGNQYVSTTGLSGIGRFVGRGTFVFGLGLDAYGVYNYYAYGANSPGAVHPVKAGTNTAIGAYGLWGGTGGALFAPIYFGFEAFYPGGFGQALEDKSNRDAKVTKIMQSGSGSSSRSFNSMNLSEHGGIFKQ